MRFLPGMVAQACTLNAWDAEAGGSKVPGQSSYINETFKKKISEMSISIASIYE